MRLTLTALTVVATMFAGSASADTLFDPDDLQKLRDTGDCIRCLLRGANLRDTDLDSANLSGAYLRDANLSGAIMQGAILCNTTMPDGSVIYSGC